MESEEKPQHKVGDLKKPEYADVKTMFEDVTDDEEAAEKGFKQIKRILEKLGTALEKASALEIGSGKGILLNLLRKQGVDIIGIDSNPRDDTPQTIVKGRIEDMQFDNESFDLVFSFAVVDKAIYHQDAELMEREIARVLKPNGVYIELASWDRLPGKALHLVSESTFERVYKKM